MNRSETTAALCLAGLLTVSANSQSQRDATLLFSTKATETTLSGTGGLAVLSQLGARSVAVYRPGSASGGQASAEKFLPAIAVQTLAGDEDGDGDAHTPDLTGGIDAVMVKPYHPLAGRPSQEWRPRTTPVNAQEVFFSVIDDVGTNVSGAPGLRGGDCGRFVRNAAGNGQVEHFLRAEQIIAALGITDRQTGRRIQPKDLQLDAITVSVDGQIFLSFEDDHVLSLGGGAVLLEDGGVAWIPASAWIADAAGNVQSVVAGGGRIALPEGRVDAMVVNAGIADVAGVCATTIVDTDGLAIDPRGGSFNVSWQGQVFSAPNLMLSGETLTGGGVISTESGGRIARLGAHALAEACGAVTDGKQVGVFDSGSVGSLDGLEVLPRRTCRFALGTPTPLSLGSSIEVEVATDLPVAGVFLLFGVSTLPVSPSIDFTPWSPGNRCFPELYPAVLAGPSVFVPTPAHAPTGQAGSFGPVVLPAIVPGVVVQAAAVTAVGVELSTPLTLH